MKYSYTKKNGAGAGGADGRGFGSGRRVYQGRSGALARAIHGGRETGQGTVDQSDPGHERCRLRAMPSKRGEHASRNLSEIPETDRQGDPVVGNDQLVFAQSFGRSAAGRG